VSRAVITGAGVVSPFGVGLWVFLDSLAAGRSAIAPITRFSTEGFPTKVAGEVPTVDVDRDRKVTLALLAAREAWAMARCGPDDEEQAGLSLALGLEQAYLEDLVASWDGHTVDWTSRELRSPVDRAGRAVARDLGLRGPVIIHVEACAAGALAVAHAASLIERGAASIVVCGGADSMVNPLGVGGFSRLGAPSPRAAPDACRPFDRRRDGLAIGEGAAVFVVEHEDRARARGVRPLARVAGWGASQDAYRATAPRPDGVAAARAIRRALARARLERVDYVNAHGTGTPLGDLAECQAIRLAHPAPVAVSSIKGAIGHLMAAAGAVEIAACLLALGEGLLPGTAHLEEPDPACDLDLVGPTPRRADTRAVLSTSFGFGGQNAAVVLTQP
jgi:3-oxoacyl-[acyl-carrier-protein] synthase II